MPLGNQKISLTMSHIAIAGNELADPMSASVSYCGSKVCRYASKSPICSISRKRSGGNADVGSRLAVVKVLGAGERFKPRYAENPARGGPCAASKTNEFAVLASFRSLDSNPRARRPRGGRALRWPKRFIGCEPEEGSSHLSPRGCHAHQAKSPACAKGSRGIRKLEIGLRRHI